ncbi:MAG TPA: CCA tRNA nucleotidyltransferase [Reyranella sp.]|nr:CCA tRNA nucleotidyltransferase [Reyranella sp.]
MKPAWMDEAAVQALLAALTRGGIAARFVGGCVRDTVLGRPVGYDAIDIAVDKPPETVMRALEAADLRVVPTGLKHGTVTAIVKGRPFELTTLRRDVETDGRRAVVAFTDDWLEDAKRRDFTFNAMYADPDGTIWDPFDGRADLLAGRVRFIGDPDQRIAEDHLRILRFFRFYAWFGKPPLDGAGFDACRRNAGTLSSLSAERIAKELLRLLAAPAPADALEAMAEAGALDHWLPEYAGTARLKALIAREDTPDPLRRLAAIVSPPATAVAKRLKLSTQQSLRLQLMLEPAVPGDLENRRAALYRLGTSLFIDRVLLEGPDDWRAALALARAWTPPELPISGADALALGLKPGPQVGALLEAVERWWIAGDFSADRAACLAELKRLAHTA